jgi:hypothetical protein
LQFVPLLVHFVFINISLPGVKTMPSRKYPLIEDTLRPYRIWNESEQKLVSSRNYVHWQNAHWGAIKELRWDVKSGVGHTLTVINVVTARPLCYYTKRVNSIDWTSGAKNAITGAQVERATEIKLSQKRIKKAPNEELFEERRASGNKKRKSSTRGYTRRSDKKEAKAKESPQVH